jgi:hypothetical protein
MSYFDLGPYSRKVSTSSPDAQLWFDRGLNWMFGFNHGEAIKCFQKALERDPECAMAHWGVSYASGPNYNLPWHRYDPHGRQMALSASYEAMERALAHAGKASPVELAMIHALPARYPQREAVDDMAVWDRAYANEMRKVFQRYPNDLEVRAVFAEAIMNQTPWQMWELRSGKPADGAGTEECQAILENAFSDFPGRVGPPRPLAPLRPLDGDVAIPTAGVACRRPLAGDRARLGSSHAHADPHRRPVWALP